MTDREQYKKVFDTVASSGMEDLEVSRLMNKKRKFSYRNRVAAAAAVAVLLMSSTGVVYAANIGGIQRTIQLWVHGDQTNATLEINDQDGSYNVTYEMEDGSESGFSGGGVAIEEDGTQRNLTEQEIMEHLTMPEVEYEEDGTVWVYYFDQKLEITDLFENGVCYVKLNHGGETLYLTVKYNDGYTVSSEKYIS